LGCRGIYKNCNREEGYVQIEDNEIGGVHSTHLEIIIRAHVRKHERKITQDKGKWQDNIKIALQDVQWMDVNWRRLGTGGGLL
jgi:hypothetical protein